MARKSERVGRGPCPMCGDRVTFHRTASGLLNFECDADDCGASAYAHKGSANERKWLASIEQPAAPEPARKEPEPAHSAPAAPARKSSLLIG